jgi:hypothetical protein
MMGRAGVLIAGVTIALSGTGQRVLAVAVCPDSNNCALVQVDVGSTTTVKPGDTFSANLTFKQGPDNGQSGGIDEIAALAMTLNIGTTSGTPLTLASCTLDGSGFPSADVLPDPSIANFNVVVENASCANGKTHCLCPDAGQTQDNFINLVIYGPNPLPTPGTTPVDIPTLPAGPQTLVTFKLKVASGAVSGNVPLHIINQVDDASRPQFTAFLSVGDKLAVDQTCVPVPGQPPCSAADSVSQVTIANATVTIMGTAVCTGDCNGDGEVTVNELITMVNIALGSANVSTCAAGDANGDGEITINEIIAGVNNALNGCSPPAAR